MGNTFTRLARSPQATAEAAGGTPATNSHNGEGRGGLQQSLSLDCMAGGGVLSAAAGLGLGDVVLQMLHNPTARPSLDDCCAAIVRASRAGHIEVVHLLLRHTGHDGRLRSRLAVEHTLDRHASTSLHWAAAYGQLRGILALLELGVRADKPNDWGLTPLCVASFHCHDPNIIRALLDGPGGRQALQGSVPEGSKETCYIVTPLHAACMAGNSAAVDVLLQHEPSVQIKRLDPLRRTPLHIACMGGHVEIIERLLQVPGIQDCVAHKDDTRVVVPVGFTPKRHAKRCQAPKERRSRAIQLLRTYMHGARQIPRSSIDAEGDESRSRTKRDELDSFWIFLAFAHPLLIHFHVMAVWNVVDIVRRNNRNIEKERHVKQGLVDCFLPGS